MTVTGDRVVVESEKVGTPERSGIVLAVNGPLLRVRWDDGAETSFIPAAGSIRIVDHLEGNAPGA